MTIRESTPEELQRDREAGAALMARLDAHLADRYDADGMINLAVLPVEPGKADPSAPPPEGVYGWTRQHAYDVSRDAALATGGFDSLGDVVLSASDPDAPSHQQAAAVRRWITTVLDPWFAESDEPAESGPTYNPAPQEG